MEPLLTTIHQYFAPHRHSALLLALIAAFVVRPLIGDTGAGFLVFSVALVLLLVVALYNINVDELVGERGVLLTQARHRRLLGWILAVAAGAERIATIFVYSATLEMMGTHLNTLEDNDSPFNPDFLTPSQWRDLHPAMLTTQSRICCARFWRLR